MSQSNETGNTSGSGAGGEKLRVTQRQAEKAGQIVAQILEQTGCAPEALWEAFAIFQPDRSCETCIHFVLEYPDYCMRWKSAIPPQHLAAGCDEHRDDDVPF